MARTLRTAAVLYTLLLSWLLLAPDPLAIFGVAGSAAEEAVDWSLSGAVQHVGAFAVLSALWCLSSVDQRGRVAAVVLSGFFGAAMELLQLLVPTRYCDWHDLLANLVGIAFGWTAARVVDALAPAGVLSLSSAGDESAAP